MPFYFPFSRYPYSYQYRNRRPYYPPHPAVSSSVVQDEQEEGQRQSKGQVSSQTQSSAQFYARPHAKYQEMRNCKQPSNSQAKVKKEILHQKIVLHQMVIRFLIYSLFCHLQLAL